MLNNSAFDVLYCRFTPQLFLLIPHLPPSPDSPILSHFNLGGTSTRQNYPSFLFVLFLPADFKMCGWSRIVFIPSLYHWLKRIRKVDLYVMSVACCEDTSEHLWCSAIIKKRKRKKGRRKRKEEEEGVFLFREMVNEWMLATWMLWPPVSPVWPSDFLTGSHCDPHYKFLSGTLQLAGILTCTSQGRVVYFNYSFNLQIEMAPTPQNHGIVLLI